MKNFILGCVITAVVFIISAYVSPMHQSKSVINYKLTGVVTSSTDEGWHQINIFNETTHDVDLVQDRCIWIEMDTVYPVGTRFYVVPSGGNNDVVFNQERE